MGSITILAECQSWNRGQKGGRGIYIPRLAQSNVGDAIDVAEGYVEVAVSIEGAAVEADVLLEGLEDKSAVVDGGFCFTRHEG